MKLSDNFDSTEFDSKDGAEMPVDVICNLKRVARNLQVLRAELNSPIIISSGYRSVEHNKAVGGEDESTHITGHASDIKVPGYTPSFVGATIERLISEGRMEQGGLSVYPTFIHYDIGFNNIKRRW